LDSSDRFGEVAPGYRADLLRFAAGAGTIRKLNLGVPRSMQNWVRFSLYNAVAGLLIGIYVMRTAAGEGYFMFVVAAPLGAFITAALLWKWLIKPGAPIGLGRVIGVGLLTGTVSHYLAFILLSIAMNVCYWTTGGCTGSLGEPPASILAMVPGALAFSFFSLLFFGWITVPASIAIGLLIRHRDPSGEAR
jgi:hypothetical protein